MTCSIRLHRWFSVVSGIVFAACVSSEQAARDPVVAIDSLLLSSDSVLGLRVTEMMSEDERERILRDIVTGDSLLEKFLGRLPSSDDTTAASSEFELDTVFFAARGAQRDAAQFAWGAMASGAVGKDIEVQIERCGSLAVCAKDSESPGKGSPPFKSMMSQSERVPSFSYVEAPALGKFFASALAMPDGTIIEEKFRKVSGRRVALSTCEKGRRVIYYAPTLRETDSPFSPISFSFIRAHEHSHHVLMQLECKPGSDKPTIPPMDAQSREFIADCKAAEMLQRDVVGGTGVVFAMYGELWQVRERARADNLLRPGCG